MSVDTLERELEASIERGEMFGSDDSSKARVEISGAVLCKLLSGHPPDEVAERRLWLRRVRVPDGLDLESKAIGLRLKLEDCEIIGDVNVSQATAGDIDMVDCVLRGELKADQLDTQWNLRLKGLVSYGAIHLRGAQIGGEFSLEGGTLEGTADDDGEIPAVLDAKGMVVGEDMSCERLTATGPVEMIDAKIGGSLQMRGAKLQAGGDSEACNHALYADRTQIGGRAVLEGLVATGEVRFFGAKVGGDVAMNGAKLTCWERRDGSVGPSFAGDGMDVADDMFCCEEFTATGEMRLLGAKIGGSLMFDDAILEARGKKDGVYNSALCADRAQIDEEVFCRRLTSIGEVRLLAVRIRGGLTMTEATLSGRDGGTEAVFLANRIHVGGSMSCEKLTANGELSLLGAKVDGQLSMWQTVLVANPGKTGLDLTAASIDQLILAFAQAECTVDLRGASVRSLWDAYDRSFIGKLPLAYKLDGFSYQSLREPLDAEHRLEWIALSQKERYSPGVYSELAAAFRRLGLLGEARRVAIAGERRARQDSPTVSFRGAWHDLLWVTIAYGYKNWFAGLWLCGLIAVGATLFAANESSLLVTATHPPAFNPVLYAIDVTIPVLDLGQAHARSAVGCMAWVSLGLAISGYALAAAVIAAAAGVFNRDQG